MNNLIITDESYIIRGMFKGEEQELFRCPKSCEDDLVSYINNHRELVGFEDDETEDLRKVPDMEMISYYRLYFRDGNWYGRWMDESSVKPDIVDCHGVDLIVNWLKSEFPRGCDYYMADFFTKNYKGCCGDKRFLIRPKYSKYYKVMVDTTYGNGDYPVRIYVYREA